jgi:hypothetical protein
MATAKQQVNRIDGVNGAPKQAEAPPGKGVAIPKIDTKRIHIRIVGDSPLITNRFTEKTTLGLANKQQGIATGGRDKQDPKADYEGSLYHHPEGGYGFPCSAFAKASIAACTSLGKSVMTKVQARQAFRVMGDMAKLVGKPRRHEARVSVQGKPAIRYRAIFEEWSCVLSICYNARVISDSELLNLFHLAGFAVGVGDWRPEKGGSYGMFHIEPV